MSARPPAHHRAPLCAVIGAGPAGSGVLASLLKEGLRAGDVDVVDPLAPSEAGTPAEWAIASDTTATKLAAQIPDALPQWRARLAAYGDGSAPLALAGAALRAKADWVVRRSVARHRASRALSLAATPDGWRIVLSNGDTLIAQSALARSAAPARASGAEPSPKAASRARHWGSASGICAASLVAVVSDAMAHCASVPASSGASGSTTSTSPARRPSLRSEASTPEPAGPAPMTAQSGALWWAGGRVDMR